jgi:excisionase family DNA binding protein
MDSKISPNPPPDNPQEVLTVPEAAALLCCSPGAIRKGVRCKYIPHFWIGKLLRFRRSELLSLKGGRP